MLNIEISRFGVRLYFSRRFKTCRWRNRQKHVGTGNINARKS